MNYIWAGMLLLGIVFSIINNRPDLFTQALMESCTDAVQFMIGLTGIIAVWCGLMSIAKESGLIDKIAVKATPAMKFLFPQEKNKDTLVMMLMSFTANVFGAGNSATVFSLKAMEMLDRENGGSPVASDTMCMFMAVSMSMIQLVPITIIKIRNDLGSQNPSDIIMPSIIVGLIAMAASIAACKYFEARERRRKRCH